MVSANLVIEVNVECPCCERVFDLLTDTHLNDEGDVLKQTISDAAWQIDSQDRLHCDCECPSCGLEIEIKGVKW
jgi:hypothetical protein